MPLKHSYTNEKFQRDDDVVVSQDVLYSILRESESNASILDHPSAAPLLKTDVESTWTLESWPKEEVALRTTPVHF